MCRWYQCEHRCSDGFPGISLIRIRVTVCTLYCARELCDRPYDVSLIGIYKRRNVNPLDGGSIFSDQSWDSDETLKNEILNLCRQHDGKAGCEPWFVDPLADKVNCHPSIKHPAPVRLRPQLTVNTDPGSEYGEITSGTMTVSPDDTLHRISPDGQTLSSDFFPISRTSTVMSSDSRVFLPDMAIPKVPPIPEHYNRGPNHKRGKSSLSSLRRFLPKPFPFSRPLSMDPQIRALSNPNAASDIEKQVVTPSTPQERQESNHAKGGSSQEPQMSTMSITFQTTTASKHHLAASKLEGHTRTMSMSSADAPEVVPTIPKLSPTKVRRSQTASYFPPTSTTRSHHHSYHPNVTSNSSPSPSPTTSKNPRAYAHLQRKNTTPLPITHPHSLYQPNTRQMHTQSVIQVPTRSISTLRLDQPQNPLRRHTQTQGQYQPSYYPTHPPVRWGSQSSLSLDEAGRTIPTPALRRDDVEVIYPSTRRARSSTYGGLNGPLSCIMESTDRALMGGESRFSGVSAGVDASVQRNVIDQSTYRGADRTSMIFY